MFAAASSATRWSSWLGTSAERPKIGVAMTPGQMQFTRMPYGATSSAAHLVSWMTAFFATE